MNWFSKKKEPEVPEPEMNEMPDFKDLDLPPLPEVSGGDIPPISGKDLPEMETTPFPEEPEMASEPEMDTPEQQHPVEVPEAEKREDPFIEKNDYQVVLENISHMDASLKKSQALMDELTTIKNDADSQLEEWRSALEDVERKLLYVDKVLFE